MKYNCFQFKMEFTVYFSPDGQASSVFLSHSPGMMDRPLKKCKERLCECTKHGLVCPKRNFL